MLLESSSADMWSDIRLTLTLNRNPAPEETVRVQMLKHVRYEITLDEIVERVTAVSNYVYLEAQFQTTVHMLSESSGVDMRSNIRLTLTLNPNPAPEEMVRIQMLKHVRYEITLDEIVECVTAVSNY